MDINRTISILGCGWYGLALADSLIEQGFRVKGSCTKEEKLEVLKGRGIEPYQAVFTKEDSVYDPSFFVCDTLVICIPPNRKSGEASIYPLKIARIKEAALMANVKKIILISSTGVYPDLNIEVDENTLPSPDTDSGKALLEAESIIKASTEYHANIVRFGGLIGPGRDPGRFFAGKTEIANGLAPVNLVHQKDCIGVIERILNLDAFGHTFNVCSEDHPTKKDFYTSAAISSGLQIPQFIEELKQWKIVRSIKLKEILSYYTRKLNGN